MLDLIKEFDTALFIALNSPHSDFMDSVMWYISTTWLWIPIYLFFLYYAFKKGGVKFLLIILLGAVCCVALADLISVHAFKNVFQRYRPSHNLDLVDLVQTVNKPNGSEYLGGKYGFVSSHAANISAIATFVIASFKQFSKKWFLVIFWALLIMYSRIYMGVHYPSDIFGGALIGFGIGIGMYQISKKLKAKFNVSSKE